MQPTSSLAEINEIIYLNSDAEHTPASPQTFEWITIGFQHLVLRQGKIVCVFG